MVNIAECIARGEITDAEIVRVIGSREGLAGLERAEDLGIATSVVARKAFDDVDSFSEAIWQQVRDAEAGLVVMAGFLCFLKIPDDYAGRVMNIHPALLPKYGGQGMYGKHVHTAVIAAGERESGCTVHFADNIYDHGPIILQRSCEVKPDDTPDTLAARVFEQECVAYPEAIRMFQRGEV